jgi:hypothetical protein
MTLKNPYKCRSGPEKAARPAPSLSVARLTANFFGTTKIRSIVLKLLPKQASTTQISQEDYSK